MKKDSINEGEAIQQGLERFLQEELAGIASDYANRTSTPSSNVGNTEPKALDMIYGSESYDIPEYEQKKGTPDRNMNTDINTDMQESAVRQSATYTLNHSEMRNGQRSNHKYDYENNEKSEQRNNRQNNRKDNGVSNNDSKRNSSKSKELSGNQRKQGKDMGKRKKKKKSKLKKLLLLLLFLLLLFAGLWYLVVGSVYNQMEYHREEELVTEPMKEEGVINILLIGNDSRNEGEDGRSDAMILLSISNKTKKIHMTSLLRDMYVEIPGREGNRLNAAYAYGGPGLLLDTIEQNLDISVNRYVLVNFQAFASLVDAVGGVDLELSNEEVKWVNAYLNEYNMLEGRDITTDYLDESLSGMIHLNGPQALAYCRNRYIGSDFERTNRQRKVLTAISEKLPAALATNSKELFSSLFPHLTTNLTQNECYSLSFSASKLLTYEIVQTSIPIEGSYKNADIRGMSVLEVDYEQNKAYIRQNIYGEE